MLGVRVDCKSDSPSLTLPQSKSQGRLKMLKSFFSLVPQESKSCDREGNGSTHRKGNKQTRRGGKQQEVERQQGKTTEKSQEIPVKRCETRKFVFWVPTDTKMDISCISFWGCLLAQTRHEFGRSLDGWAPFVDDGPWHEVSPQAPETRPLPLRHGWRTPSLLLGRSSPRPSARLATSIHIPSEKLKEREP